MIFVIHAPPRVGGVSIRRYCEESLGLKTMHAHYLLNAHYYQNKERVRNSIDNYGMENLKIITAVRDPIARNLSEYWRRLHIDRTGTSKSLRIVREQGLTHRVGTHEEKFYAFVDHYRQHYFMGSEVMPFWGIDIFRKPFIPPYTIYDDRLLVIRCEDLTEHGTRALMEFAGVKSDDPFLHVNRYPRQRDNIFITDAYMEAMYQDNKFPNWFYSEDEIEEWRKKWITMQQR